MYGASWCLAAVGATCVRCLLVASCCGGGVLQMLLQGVELTDEGSRGISGTSSRWGLSSVAWSPSCTTGFGDGRCFGHDVQDQADQLQFEGGLIHMYLQCMCPKQSRKERNGHCYECALQGTLLEATRRSMCADIAALKQLH